jgi:FtsZ-binding cell division protein ZapB
MIEYPSALTIPSQQRIIISKKDAATLKTKLWEAQRLARVILGREAPQMKSADILEAIRTYAQMKNELERLRQQSTMMEALLVPRSHETSSGEAEFQIELNEHKNCLYDTVATDLTPKENQIVASCIEGKDLRKISDNKSMSSPPDHTDDDCDNSVAPSVCQSLGVGLIDDVESRIINWQQTFEKITMAHENYVRECQEDLEEVFVSLSSIEESAVDPSRLRETTDHLMRLVALVEAFPSNHRIHQLESELREHRREEQKAKAELSLLLVEVDELKYKNRMLQDPTQRNNESKHSASHKVYSRLVAYKKKIISICGKSPKGAVAIGVDETECDKSTDKSYSSPPLPSYVNVEPTSFQDENFKMSESNDTSGDSKCSSQIDEKELLRLESSDFLDTLPHDENDDKLLLFDNSSEQSSDDASNCFEDQSVESYFENLEVQSSNSERSFEISATWIFKKDISPSKSMASSETKITITDSSSETPSSLDEENKPGGYNPIIPKQTEIGAGKGLFQRAKILIGLQ